MNQIWKIVVSAFAINSCQFSFQTIEFSNKFTERVWVTPEFLFEHEFYVYLYEEPLSKSYFNLNWFNDQIVNWK